MNAGQQIVCIWSISSGKDDSGASTRRILRIQQYRLENG